MSATSSALTGKSSRERSVCGTTAKRAGRAQRPRHGRELAEQDAEERRLAAAVGAQDAHALAGVQRERHVGEHRRRAVAGGQPLGLHEDQIPAIGHPRAPAVKPRTIASALARSMVR